MAYRRPTSRQAEIPYFKPPPVGDESVLKRFGGRAQTVVRRCTRTVLALRRRVRSSRSVLFQSFNFLASDRFSHRIQSCASEKTRTGLALSTSVSIDSAKNTGSGASADRSRRIRPLPRGHRMTKPIARDPMYRRRSFDADIIELCVRWYITYRLSYRDLLAMMAERGVEVSHTTIFTMGRSVCSRVREAMESTCAPHRLVLAGRRDVRFHSRQMALPVSSCG
jgi:hypothetical protein